MALEKKVHSETMTRTDERVHTEQYYSGGEGHRAEKRSRKWEGERRNEASAREPA